MKKANNSGFCHCKVYSIFRQSPAASLGILNLSKDNQRRLLRSFRSIAMTVGMIFLFSPSIFAAEKLRIVTTTNTLASLTREVAGDLADIHHVARPKQNIHNVEPTPKDVLKVIKAQAFIHQGLDLEAWRDPLLVAAGNPLFLGDAKSAVDVSREVILIEIPSSLSRIHGDIHAFGNPHYAIDPENAKIIVSNIAQGLSRIFPEHTETFSRNLEVWNSKMDKKLNEWKRRVEPYQGTPVVTYHRSWPYFTNRFGLVTAAQIEPKPGIPPTPKYLLELIRLMKEKNVKLIIKEPFNESNTPNALSRETGAVVVVLDQEVGATAGVDDYIGMIEHNIKLVEAALLAENNKT